MIVREWFGGRYINHKINGSAFVGTHSAGELIETIAVFPFGQGIVEKIKLGDLDQNIGLLGATLASSEADYKNGFYTRILAIWLNPDCLETPSLGLYFEDEKWGFFTGDAERRLADQLATGTPHTSWTEDIYAVLWYAITDYDEGKLEQQRKAAQLIQPIPANPNR